MDNVTKQPSGLLHTKRRLDKFAIDLRLPSSELEPYIEHYWIVNWDLRGQEPFHSENLPHPAVHLVIQQGQSGIFGIVKEKFVRVLKDKDFVFGIKFRPGAFFPFAGIPVHTLTGRTVSASDMFGPDFDRLEDAVLQAEEASVMIGLAESFLRARLPEPDENVAFIRTVVDTIVANRTITEVEHIAGRFQCSTRLLQRLFSKYVGINPKWVIRRYRLLEVADQLADSHPANWSQMAVDLGYYDQSHFIKDFKSIVGLSPDEYMKRGAR